MRARHAKRNRQPQASALPACGEEGLEDPGLGFGTHAHPGIPDAHAHQPLIDLRGERYLPVAGRAGLTGLQGVLEQVDQSPGQRLAAARHYKVADLQRRHETHAAFGTQGRNGLRRFVEQTAQFDPIALRG